jgi:site-specific recombinase XerD
VTKRSPSARSYPDRIGRVAVGPLAPTVLRECSSWLSAQRYSPGSAAGILNVLSRLSVWMRSVGAEVDDVDEELLARFIADERSREVVCASAMRSLGTMRRFLRARGYLRPTEVASGHAAPALAVVAGWTSWMREECGLTENTVAARVSYAAGLLDVLTEPDGELRWTRLDALQVNAFVAERGLGYGVVARAHIVTAVRCLLRWALITGHLDRDLSGGILKPAGTKRSLPRGVGSDQVASLLRACDPATPIGVRDRALVLILVRLGLRAGEAAQLGLDDIDWTHGQLKVTGKGREHTLPLPVDVGQALEAWLRLRPLALDRSVFVRMKAPRQAMTTQGISGVVARVSGLAGLDPIYAHRLRHTAAMDVLAAGGTLTEAKELLGHAYMVTTMAYAKVDLASLRELVVPFGQVP